MKLTEEQDKFLSDKIKKLQKSKFRSKFHLKEKDIFYIQEKTMDVLEGHAKDFVCHRLAPELIHNDGKQTPMTGHPVFIAQHATATCCRKCLYRWHHIGMKRPLTQKEQTFIVCLIMKWIDEEVKSYFSL